MPTQDNARPQGQLLRSGRPSAAQRQPDHRGHGCGKADCKRFLEVRRRGHLDQTLRQWVFGYVSAYNILVAPDGNALDGANAVIALAADACTSDPSLRISGAVNSILAGE